MIKALNLTELAPLLGLTHRGLAYRVKQGYKGWCQKVLLPFTPKNKKQKEVVTRYIQDFIVCDKWGKIIPVNPCVLEPCPTGDIELEYYTNRYRYKIPEGYKILSKDIF